MKFKVGDKVRVKKDLIIGEIYGSDSFVEPMAEYRGLVTEVEKTLFNEEYRLKGCQYWLFTDEMLEKAFFTKEDLQTGDLVKLRNGDLFVFINKQLGFCSIYNSPKIKEECFLIDDNTASYCFINNDFAHFKNYKKYDVVKVYRRKTKKENFLSFPDALADYEIMWKGNNQ